MHKKKKVDHTNGIFARIRVPKNARPGQKFKINVQHTERGKCEMFVVAGPRNVAPGQLFQVRLSRDKNQSRYIETKHATYSSDVLVKNETREIPGTKYIVKEEQTPRIKAETMNDEKSRDTHQRRMSTTHFQNSTVQKRSSLERSQVGGSVKLKDENGVVCTASKRREKADQRKVDRSFTEKKDDCQSFCVRVTKDMTPGSLIRVRTKTNAEYIAIVPADARFQDCIVVTIGDPKSSYRSASQLVLRLAMREKIAKILEMNDKEKEKQIQRSTKLSKAGTRNKVAFEDDTILQKIVSDENVTISVEKQKEERRLPQNRNNGQQLFSVRAPPSLRASFRPTLLSTPLNGTEILPSSFEVDIAMPEYCVDEPEKFSFLLEGASFRSRFERSLSAESARFRKSLRIQERRFSFITIPSHDGEVKSDDEISPWGVC